MKITMLAVLCIALIISGCGELDNPIEADEENAIVKKASDAKPRNPTDDSDRIAWHPMMVRVYHVVSDTSESTYDIDTINETLGKAQVFFADEMERHGYGRKTFSWHPQGIKTRKIAVDAKKNPHANWLVLWEQTSELTGRHKEDIIHLFFVDTPDVPYGAAGLGRQDQGGQGYAWIFNNAMMWTGGWKVVAHELVHAAGDRTHRNNLPQEMVVRNEQYLMTQGLRHDAKVLLAVVTAIRLNKHPAFQFEVHGKNR